MNRVTPSRASKGERVAQRSRRRQPKGKRATVTFEFTESQHHRVIHVDGAWGGITGQRLIHMDLFSEYMSPPDSINVQLEAGKPPKELARVGGEVITREREVTAMLNLRTAVAIRDWLSQKIDELVAVSEEVARAAETEASHGNASD